MKLPLNGTKTHPLSDAAKAILASLAREPIPCSQVNPGIVDRLLREGVVEIERLPSPFKTHKGKHVPHLRLKAPSP